MEAEQIVKENFQGLDKLIADKDLLIFYKGLILTCIEDYSNDLIEENTKLRKDANEADHSDTCMCRYCAPEFHKLKTNKK